MATLNKFAPKTSGELPTWLPVEAYYNGGDGWCLRVGIRCRDADLKILDIPIEVLVAPGRSERITLTKREMLEIMHRYTVAELAKISLEE